MNKVVLPSRSASLGIGKEIGGSVYLHRQYETLLGEVVIEARAAIPATFAYTVVKYNRRTGIVSFVASPDFDSCPEPTVGDIWTVSLERTARFRSCLPDPYIYHHKWLMVADAYQGFDVEASKERSRLWLALEGVDKSRIGRQSYWQRSVVPQLLLAEVDSSQKFAESPNLSGTEQDSYKRTKKQCD